MKSLVILQLDDIGDYIIFTDSLRFYRRIYPAAEWRITLIGFSSWADLAAFRVGDWIDEFVPFDPGKFKNNLLYRFNTMRKLGGIKADLLLNPNIARTELMDLVVKKINAGRKIGLVRERLGRELSQTQGDDHYDQLYDLNDNPKHELDVYRTFQNKLGFSSDLPYKTEAIWGKEDTEAVKGMIGDNNKYAIISPYSGHYLKDWPIQKLNEVVEWLADKHHLRVYYIGDKNQAGKIDLDLRDIPGLTRNLAGKMNLREAAYLLSNSELMVSNDSMSAHMAVATGTPLVCLQSGMHYGRFFPYPYKDEKIKVVASDWDCFGCFWNCKYPLENGRPAPCIQNIEVESVKKAIKEIYEIA